MRQKRQTIETIQIIRQTTTAMIGVRSNRTNLTYRAGVCWAT